MVFCQVFVFVEVLVQELVYDWEVSDGQVGFGIVVGYVGIDVDQIVILLVV